MPDLTITEVSKALGISQPTGSRYKAQGMPLHSLNAAREWYAQRVNARVRVDNKAGLDDRFIPEATPDYQQSRALREAAEAVLAQIKVRREQDELIEKAAVKAELAKQFTPIREGLLNIPARLAPELHAAGTMAEVQTMLDREIRAVLAQYVGEG